MRSRFPGGCATLDAAAEHVIRGVGAEELADLDERMQTMIRQQFTALVHVCLTSANLLRNLEAAMQVRAEALVNSCLSSANAAELFFAQHPDEGAAEEVVRAAFDEGAVDPPAVPLSWRVKLEYQLVEVQVLLHPKRQLVACCCWYNNINRLPFHML